VIFLIHFGTFIPRMVKMNRFKNQTVLITGALTGIGRTTALAFAREWANLVVSGRHEEAGNRLVADLTGQCLAVDGGFTAG